MGLRERGYFDCDYGAVRHDAIGITSDDSGDVGSYNQHPRPPNNNASNARTPQTRNRIYTKSKTTEKKI